MTSGTPQVSKHLRLLAIAPHLIEATASLYRLASACIRLRRALTTPMSAKDWAKQAKLIPADHQLLIFVVQTQDRQRELESINTFVAGTPACMDHHSHARSRSHSLQHQSSSTGCLKAMHGSLGAPEWQAPQMRTRYRKTKAQLRGVVLPPTWMQRCNKESTGRHTTQAMIMKGFLALVLQVGQIDWLWRTLHVQGQGGPRPSQPLAPKKCVSIGSPTSWS